jgi:Fe-S cluster biogenesis protein NfuA
MPLRFTLAVLLATVFAVAASTGASAYMGDKDVARMVSFGGACKGCEFSGRKLHNASFMGATSRARP